MEAAWTAIVLKNNKRDMDISLSYRATYPSLIFFLKGATQDTLNRFETDITKKLIGKNKYGKALALNAEQASLISPPIPDLNFGDSEMIINEIAAVFRVPNSLLLMKDASLASAKAAERLWLSSTIQPILQYDSEMWNERLLPMFGIEDDAFLAYDTPTITPDSADVTATNLFAASLITRNEARELIGYDKLDDAKGDIFVDGTSAE
jgi:hypothetical protein